MPPVEPRKSRGRRPSDAFLAKDAWRMRGVRHGDRKYPDRSALKRGTRRRPLGWVRTPGRVRHWARTKSVSTARYSFSGDQSRSLHARSRLHDACQAQTRRSRASPIAAVAIFRTFLLYKHAMQARGSQNGSHVNFRRRQPRISNCVPEPESIGARNALVTSRKSSRFARVSPMRPYGMRTAPLPPIAAPATAPTGPATIAPAAAPVVARVAVFGPQAPTARVRAQMRMTGGFGMDDLSFPAGISLLWAFRRYRRSPRRNGNPRQATLRQM